MINTKIKKYLRSHILSGFMLGVVIVSATFVSMYYDSIDSAVNKMNRVVVNTSKMRQSIQDIDLAMKKINNLLPKNYYEKSHKELLLFALDDIKAVFKDAEITISSFEEDKGELLLGIGIKTSMENYRNFLKQLEYLQNLRFPSFHLKTIVIEKSHYKQRDDVMTSKIEGVLKMPVGRLKVNI